MECSFCGAPLTGGTDTFGKIKFPLCQLGFPQRTEPVYRMVHTLEMDDAGNIVAEGIRMEADTEGVTDES